MTWRAFVLCVAAGLAIAAGLRRFEPLRESGAGDELMAVIVWSDGTAKSGSITANDCAALAELAYDGKVFKPSTDDENERWAIAFTCAPARLVKSSFGRRHTP